MDANPYGTHVPVLSVLATAGPIRHVIEFGGGLYSTPLFLDKAVFPDLTRLLTVETSPEWADTVATEDRRHTVMVVGRAGDASTWIHRRHDLILVDDSDTPTERVATLNAVSGTRPRALVVVHDFEQRDYQEATRFDHVAVSSVRTPWTAVAWNEDSHHGSDRLHRLVSRA